MTLLPKRLRMTLATPSQPTFHYNISLLQPPLNIHKRCTIVASRKRAELKVAHSKIEG